MTFADLLKEEMASKNVKMADLALKSGVGLKAVWLILNRPLKRGPCLTTVLRLMRALDVPFSRIGEVAVE